MSRPTPEMKAAIVADRMAGMSLNDLAAKHGVSRSSVKRWTHGITAEKSVPRKVATPTTYTPTQRRKILTDHYESGRSIYASAELHGLSRSTLKRWIELDESWIEDDHGADMTAGEWVLCPRRRVQVWRAA